MTAALQIAFVILATVIGLIAIGVGGMFLVAWMDDRACARRDRGQP